MRKEDLIKQSICKNLKSKDELLQNILNAVREEEKKAENKADLDISILALISRKDMHGYGIIKEMQIKSEVRFLMQEGEIYPILHRLEGEGFIESYWNKGDNIINRKYYKLTRNGKAYLKTKTEKVEKITLLNDIGKIEKMIG